MKFLVCISNVPDTTTKIAFTPDNKEFNKAGVQFVINPWDEYALTRAIELKEANAGSTVTVLNVGEADTEPNIRKALAIGADGALLDDFEIVRSGRCVHVVNAPSPAATASLAIGSWIADEVARAHDDADLGA